MSNITQLLNTDEFIYFLGYFWADGSLSKGGKSITLSIQEDDALEIVPNIEIINNFLTKPFTSGKSKPKKEHWKTMMRFYSGDKELCDFLQSNDFGNKSINPPSTILSIIPPNKHNIFYLGFFDGDGCIYNGENSHKLYSFSFSGPYDYNWTFLEDLLTSLEIKSKIYRSKRTKGSNSTIVSTGMFSVEKLYNYFYTTNLITLSRKKKKFLEILEHVKLQTSKQKGVCFTGGKYYSHISINNNRILLGIFDTEDEAIKQRKIGEQIYDILLAQFQVIP